MAPCGNSLHIFRKYDHVPGGVYREASDAPWGVRDLIFLVDRHRVSLAMGCTGGVPGHTQWQPMGATALDGGILV